MHTSLYEEVGSKYGLERGDSIEGRNVSHLGKRDYIRKLSNDAKQAEKAVKGLQTMTRRLEAQIFRSQSQIEEIEKSLAPAKSLFMNMKFKRPGYKNRLLNTSPNLKTRLTSYTQRSWNWSDCNDLKIQIQLIINQITINLELILLTSQLNILWI